MSIFPDRTALIRLGGGVLAEQHDDWNEARLYLGLDPIQQSQSIRTIPGTNATAKEDDTD